MSAPTHILADLASITAVTRDERFDGEVPDLIALEDDPGYRAKYTKAWGATG